MIERALAADEVRVGIAFGGICGSDLHYYHRGAVAFVCANPWCWDTSVGHRHRGPVPLCTTLCREPRPRWTRAALPHMPLLSRGSANLCTNMSFGQRRQIPPCAGRVFRAARAASGPDRSRALRHRSARPLGVAEPLSVALHAVARAVALSAGRDRHGFRPDRAADCPRRAPCGRHRNPATDIEKDALLKSRSCGWAHPHVNVRPIRGARGIRSGGRLLRCRVRGIRVRPRHWPRCSA